MAIKGKMSINRSINQFNGGEISPQLEGRYDWDKYNYSSKLCQNFIPLVEGSLKRRGGTHFVAKTKEIKKVKIRFIFTYMDDSLGSDIILRIGYTTTIVKNDAYQLTVNVGDVLEYNVSASGYVEVNGVIEAENDEHINIHLIKIEDSATLTINTDPIDAECYLNGVKTKSIVVVKNSHVDVKVRYRNEETLARFTVTEDMTETVVVQYTAYRTNYYEHAETVFFNRGYYQVLAIGAGGGAGGGSYGDDHKRRGGAGGGGSGYYGRIILDGEYTVITGRGGFGGGKGHDTGNDGGNGSATIIRDVIIVGGGEKGEGSQGDRDGYDGKGGVVTIINEDVVLDEGVNGNDGIYDSGGNPPNIVSPYDIKNNGRGGNANYQETGDYGMGGYLLITYIGRVE